MERKTAVISPGLGWGTAEVIGGLPDTKKHIDRVLTTVFGISFEFFVTYVLELYGAKISEREIIQSVIGMFAHNKKNADAFSEKVFGIPFDNLVAYMIETCQEFAPEDQYCEGGYDGDEYLKKASTAEYVISSIIDTFVQDMMIIGAYTMGKKQIHNSGRGKPAFARATTQPQPVGEPVVYATNPRIKETNKW